MSEEKKVPDPQLYQVKKSSEGWSLLLGHSGAIVDGFETRDATFDWLLAYFDNNLISNTRLSMEKIERSVQLSETLKLQRAALLEVDPNAKPN